MYQFGLIGYPIQHSLSPWIHKQFLEKANLKGTYSIIEFDPNESFAVQINKLKETKINGFNVTVPYKEKIIPYLDDIDTGAKRIGAVNTVLNKNGKWIGYNTDGIGYIRSLKSNFPNLFSNQMNRILIIGAGGASRGIYYSLIDAGFNLIDIANRTKESAIDIAKLKQPETNTTILSLEEAEKTVDLYDVIIQTTSVGMYPNADKSIISIDLIKENSIVSDIVYQPLLTNILKQAKSYGASIHFGHTMLLYQAQFAFEIWTNQHVSIGNMENKMKVILEGE